MKKQIYRRLQKEVIDRLPTLKVVWFTSKMRFYTGEQLQKKQEGYRFDQQRRSLLSEKEGGWRWSWYVIGETNGQAILIDLGEVGWPVYVVEIGAVGWKPRCIVARFTDLLIVLRWLGQLVYEMSEEEKCQLIQNIVQLGGGKVEASFWKEWIMPEGKRREDYF